MVEFKIENILQNNPEKTYKYNLILCRNVIIYFDKNTVKNILYNFYHQLELKGYLFLGHSESISSNNNKFERVSPTIYQKK